MTLVKGDAKEFAQRCALPLYASERLFRCKQTPGLVRSGYRVPVAAPPIDPAEEFHGTKSEPGKLVGTLCRRIATYPVAIDDIDLAVVEPSSGLGTDLAMWEVDGAGDVGSGVRIAGAGVDYDDVGKSGSEINGQIPRISVEAQLVFHHARNFTWLGRAVFEDCGNFMRHDRPRSRRIFHIRSSKLEDQPRADARNRARSGGDGLGVSKKAPVWGATRTGRQAFICQRQGDIALTGANGSLGQGPVHDVTLRVAAADLP
jgi:hypothetical protein